ncbi:hypothetical protein JCM19233_914 [Vibrio astriarenae]|nr:hypothetical protein JCM19233_914 [Vibrio sp. C7]
MSYTGHTVKSVRDFDKPNYNLGSKDMGKALINASLEQQGGVKNNTHLSRLPALRQFAQYLKEETSVRRLNHITKAHVMRYGEHLKEKVDEHEGLSNTSARNYLSHVNRALAQARGDNKLVVCAKSDLNFTPISGIASKDGSMTRQQHDKLLANADTPVSLVANWVDTGDCVLEKPLYLMLAKRLKSSKARRVLPFHEVQRWAIT